MLKTINCFLNMRQKALPRRQAEEANGVSQDEFGMFEIDYDDPALSAMLGVEGGVAGTAQSEVLVKDRALSEASTSLLADDALQADLPRHSQVLRTTLSPAIFRLVSNIFATDRTERNGPTITDRSKYAQEVVECWSRCLVVMIDNDTVVRRPSATPFLTRLDCSLCVLISRNGPLTSDTEIIAGSASLIL